MCLPNACQNMIAGVGRSNSNPVLAEAELPALSDTIRREQSTGLEAQPGSAGSTPSISPSGTPKQEPILSPSRIDALRERMNKISAAAALSDQIPSPAVPAATVRTDTSHMTGTMEALQQRMSLLRKKQEPQ